MSAAPAWALADVSAGHDGKPVVRVPALEIAAGTVTAIVGANGAGKTTLLGLLALQALPLGGGVTFLGEAVTAARLPALRRRVGYVPQSPYLLRGTVHDNVEAGLRLRGMPRAARSARVEATLAALGLTRLAARSARELSGGEAQKVALARVLVFEPEALVLDEPFSHLDPTVAAEIAALIARIGESRTQTVVFSTHDEVRARTLAGRVLGIAGGQVGPAALLNVYAGRYDLATRIFDTGRLRIQVADDVRAATRVAVDPAHVVLSATRLESSMRNCYAGRVTALLETDSGVQVTVSAGEPIVALVSHAALAQGGFDLGRQLWVSFKSSAVRAL